MASFALMIGVNKERERVFLKNVIYMQLFHQDVDPPLNILVLLQEADPSYRPLTVQGIPLKDPLNRPACLECPADIQRG